MSSSNIRFNYYSDGWNWWWQVDNIQMCVGGGAVGESDLSIVKTGASTSATEGSYTLMVSNAGPDDATGVTVTDMLPAGVTYISDDCGGVAGTPWTWNLGSLANGNSAMCTINVAIVDSMNTGNTADVTGDQTDPNTSDNSASSALPAFQNAIPTLGTAGVVLLIVLLAGVGLFIMRRMV